MADELKELREKCKNLATAHAKVDDAWGKSLLENESLRKELKEAKVRVWRSAIARLNILKPNEVDEFNYRYIIADFEKARKEAESKEQGGRR